MVDDAFDAWLALTDLHAAWESRLELVRSSAADLLSASRGGEHRSPIADRQLRTRLLEAATTASVLNEVCQDFVEVLSAIEEARIAAHPQAHASHPQGGATPGDGSPSTF